MRKYHELHKYSTIRTQRASVRCSTRNVIVSAQSINVELLCSTFKEFITICIEKELNFYYHILSLRIVKKKMRSACTEVTYISECASRLYLYIPISVFFNIMFESAQTKLKKNSVPSCIYYEINNCSTQHTALNLANRLN